MLVSGATILVFVIVAVAVVGGLVLIFSAMAGGTREVSASRRCGQCNTPNRDDANYCARCGRKLGGDATTRSKP